MLKKMFLGYILRGLNVEKSTKKGLLHSLSPYNSVVWTAFLVIAIAHKAHQSAFVILLTCAVSFPLSVFPLVNVVGVARFFATELVHAVIALIDAFFVLHIKLTAVATVSSMGGKSKCANETSQKYKRKKTNFDVIFHETDLICCLH